VGLGIGFSLNREFEIGLRYNFGLTDSFKYKYHDNNYNNSSLLALTLTYLFH